MNRPAPVHLGDRAGDAEAAYPVGPFRAWMMLVLVGLLYLMSFVDRFILALLVEPLKHDLNVTEFQLGLLFGTTFALFYAVLGLPFARLADRSNRHRIIVAGATLWSLSTLGAAFVMRYEWLVCLRLGLAIGEAALTPSVFSMIGDLFPARRRARAASVYSAFGMLGAGGSYIIAGLLIAWTTRHLDPGSIGGMKQWQMVFLCVGLPSLILTGVFAILVREPKRTRDATSEREQLSSRHVLEYARSRGRFFLYLFSGAGLCQVPAYAMIAWMPHILAQDFRIAPGSAGILFGVCAIVATVMGTLGLPLASERLRARWGTLAAVRLSAIAAFASLAALATSAASPHLMPFLLLSALGLMLLSGATNNILAALQNLVPTHMRATFASLCLLSITVLGLGIGPPLFAVIKALLPANLNPGTAIAVLSAMTALPGGWLLLRAGMASDPLSDEVLPSHHSC